MAATHADLPEFRRIDAVEPDFDAGDADAVAVDHLRGTDEIRGAPVGDQAGGGKAGQSEAGKQRHAGAAVHPGNHIVRLQHVPGADLDVVSRSDCMVQEERSIMNVRRGLLWAWVLFSITWLIYIGVLAKNAVPAEIASTKYTYVYQLRAGIDPDDMEDRSRPLYEIIRSPSDEKLDSEFDLVRSEYLSDWDEYAEEGKLKIVEFPDHSKLYLSPALTEADQTYLSQQFWDQRPIRWTKAVEPWLAAAALPPIIVLLLGLGTVWVIRSFQ